MRILVDMNLSPGWCAMLRAAGHDSTHWSTIGKHDAPDTLILRWAHDNGCIVLTHDLDFGDLLAASGDSGPSVLQVRTRDVMPETMGALVLSALAEFESELRRGALIVVDPARARARVLPIRERGHSG